MMELKIHIGEREIADRAGRFAEELDRREHVSAEMRKRDMAHGRAVGDVHLGHQPDLARAHAVEMHVLDRRSGHAAPFDAEIHADAAVGNCDVRHAHMADGERAHADAEHARRGGQHAVRDDDVFAAAVFVLQPPRRAADGDRVVAGVYDAVGHGHAAAGVDVQSVGVGRVGRVENPQPARLNVVAAVEKAAPAGRRGQREIAHGYAATFDEADHLAGAQIHRVPLAQKALAPGVHPEAQRLYLVGEERFAAAVDRARAGQRHVLALNGEDQVLGVPALVRAAAVLRVCVVGVVIVKVRAGLQARAVLKMQLHMAPKKDRAGSVKARGYDHPAAARSRARVDGGLNRGSAERLAARGRAEIDD